MNINLKKDVGEDANHYAQLGGFSVSFNTKADDWESISESITTNDIYVDDIVKETIASYTVSTIDQTQVKTEIVKKIQEKYNTKAVVLINLNGFLTA